MTDEARPNGERKEDRDPETETTSPKQVITTGAIVFAIILGVWLLTLIVTLNAGCWKPGSMAELGDAFGTINALFSGLALVGLFYQSREFAAQVNEMKAQTKHFEQDVLNLREQNDQMKEEFVHALIQANMKSVPVFEAWVVNHVDFTIRIKNFGETTYEVRVRQLPEPFEHAWPLARRLSNGDYVDFKATSATDIGTYQLTLEISFITSLGKKFKQEILIDYIVGQSGHAKQVLAAEGGTIMSNVAKDIEEMVRANAKR